MRPARHVQENHFKEACMQHNQHDQNFDENVVYVANLIFAHYITHTCISVMYIFNFHMHQARHVQKVIWRRHVCNTINMIKTLMKMLYML